MIEQKGLCPICKEPLLHVEDNRSAEGTHIDHDHKCCPGIFTCGKCVRGIIHGRCNRGIGFFKENPVSLRQAANYLEFYETVQ